jgi:hypothetical protein
VCICEFFWCAMLDFGQDEGGELRDLGRGRRDMFGEDGGVVGYAGTVE